MVRYGCGHYTPGIQIKVGDIGGDIPRPMRSPQYASYSKAGPKKECCIYQEKLIPNIVLILWPKHSFCNM